MMMLLLNIKVVYLFFFGLFSCVYGSSQEEVDRLRSEWRNKVLEYYEMMNETKRLMDVNDIEDSILTKAIRVNLQLVGLNNLTAAFLKAESYKPIVDKKLLVIKELEDIKKQTEEEYKKTMKSLIDKEASFQVLWKSDAFVKAFDIIFKNSLLSPTPKFPEIYTDKNEIKKTLEKRQELIGLEGQMIEMRTRKLKEINKKIFEIEIEIKNLDFIKIIREKFKLLKAKVIAMKLREEDKKTKLVDVIERYEKNQKEELIWMGKKNLNDSTIKLKQYIDFLMAGDQWKLRLGPMRLIDITEIADIATATATATGTPTSTSKSTATAPAVPKTKDPAFIDKSIISASRLVTDSKTLQSQYTHLIKHNDAEKMRYIAAMLGAKGKTSKFVLKKYSKIVEGMHKYMVKAEEKVVKGLYDEVINDLVLDL